jgi:UDP-N-acetyl-D-galactosamine dehydrogenase
MVGYRPNVILAGRKINDELPLNIIQRIKSIILRKSKFRLNRILFLGVTFKENCNDIRNSGSIKLLEKIKSNFPRSSIDVIDPLVSKKQFYDTSKIELKKISDIKNSKYQLIVIAVAHELFKSKINKIIMNNSYDNSIIVDLKSILPKKMSDFRL